MTNFSQYWPLNGNNVKPSMGGSCGIPEDCCCKSGNVRVKTDERDSFFISFENIIKSRENAASPYKLDKLLSFDFEDALMVKTSLTAGQIADLTLVTQTLPFNVGTIPNISIEQIKLFIDHGNRGLRIQYNVPALSPVGARFKINFKIRLLSSCEGLPMEITDCAMIEIVKCL